MGDVYMGGTTPDEWRTQADRYKQVSRVAQDVIQEMRAGGYAWPYDELVEVVKLRCAKKHIWYDSRTVGEAIEKWHR